MMICVSAAAARGPCSTRDPRPNRPAEENAVATNPLVTDGRYTGAWSGEAGRTLLQGWAVMVAGDPGMRQSGIRRPTRVEAPVRGPRVRAAAA